MLRKVSLLLLFICSIAFAQATATGDPETVLAGIDLQHTPISQIEKMYGQHDTMLAVGSDSYPEGTKLYKWGRLTVTLKVLTEPSSSGELIKAIEIQGEGEPGNKPINSTGRGLKLGAKSSEAKKVYGINAEGGNTTLTWTDGTSLVIRVNDKGRVDRLELHAAETSPAH